ncbi:MAG: tRNA (adenine(22)-N(1))-methyltransferase [Wujia sp.]
MIKLSDRMQAVADMVAGEKKEGLVVADIGCDHAYVSIYLVQNAICHMAIAMDLRPGPLKIAGDNIRECGLASAIETRLSDGFEKLVPREADCAVIAGMGGLLMVDILKAGYMHTDAGITLVLQPQSDAHKVREYILEIGYDIFEECMLIDEGKYYTVMKAAPAKDRVKPYSDVELLYGRKLIEGNSPVLRSYLEDKLHKNQELMGAMQHILSDKAKLRLEELMRENDLINKTLQNDMAGKRTIIQR